jgi:hypothetical protein
MVEAALAEVRGIPVRESGRKERQESMMNLKPSALRVGSLSTTHDMG